MKRFGKIILTTTVALAISANSFAQTLQLTYDGKVHNYTGNICKLKINGELITTDMPPVIIENRTLVPARAVFEKLGATVKWDDKTKKVTVGLDNTNIVLKINDKNASINNKTVGLDVPAKIINDRTMIPIRFVSEQLDMKVDWNAKDYIVSVDKKSTADTLASLNKIECGSIAGNDQVILSTNNVKDYNVFRLQDPERIVIDLPNTSILVDNKVDVKSNQIKGIRYSQFEENTARVVLDIAGPAQYKVEEQRDKLVVNVMKPNLSDRGDVDREGTPTTTSTSTVKPTNTPTPTSTPTAVATPAPSVTPIATMVPGSNPLQINYSQNGSIDLVAINLNNYKDYKIFRLTDPNRIVIDIPGAQTGKDQQSINIGSGMIKTIRHAMLDDNTARIVMDVIGQPQYQVEEIEGQLLFSLESATYKNMFYQNYGDRVGFKLPGAKLTEGDSNLVKHYTGSYDETGTKYTITFPSNLADLGSGTMKINDEYLDSVEIYSDPTTNKSSVTFNAKDQFVYQIITRPSENDTAVTILKPAAQGEKLVVIDPGHGGSEPGAVSFNTSEKDINLDIALRLSKLLKSNNIRTYIIREDDSFIGLYERAYIANNLNATLFLSIHNNAYYSSFKGTETLYYPTRTNASGFTSKRFAQIIEGNLVNTLNTNNRGIVERPNLVVLKATTMPAALAEVAFMTNKDEFTRLQSNEFKQNAAAALYTSIVQALSETN